MVFNATFNNIGIKFPGELFARAIHQIKRPCFKTNFQNREGQCYGV